MKRYRLDCNKFIKKYPEINYKIFEQKYLQTFGII